MATVHVAEQCLIPGDVATLAAFRRWAGSDEFPQTGRIDWVASHIEVDMSPEDIFTHGTLKTALVGRLWPLAHGNGIHLFTGETRVTSVAGDLSVEPDVVAVSDAAIDAGRVRLVPASGGRPDRFTELEGAPDFGLDQLQQPLHSRFRLRDDEVEHHTGLDPSAGTDRRKDGQTPFDLI